MGNELDELKGPVNESGRDVNVIDKQLVVKVGIGSKIFEIILWAPILIAVAATFFREELGSDVILIIIWIAMLIPGLSFLLMKVNANKYFNQLQQRRQYNSSQIDNYLEQRVEILKNATRIVSQSIDLDKDVMKSVAALRGGVQPNEENRSEMAGQVDAAMNSINVAIEAYPELRGHGALADAMQQNSYLQKEITAARELYNDIVLQWNTDIYAWPTKMIVAAKRKLTTRIPFTASKETKEQARSVFF